MLFVFLIDEQVQSLFYACLLADRQLMLSLN